MTESQLFDLATLGIEEVFSHVYVRYFKADPETGSVGSEATLNLAAKPSSFTEQRHRFFGKCYSLHPEEDIRKLGVYYIKITLY